LNTNIWLLHTYSIYKISTRSHTVLVVFVVKLYCSITLCTKYYVRRL